VRPTHRLEIRTVFEWCVGRTLPLGLNLMALGVNHPLAPLKPRWSPNLQIWTRLVKVRRRFQSWSFGLQRRNFSL